MLDTVYIVLQFIAVTLCALDVGCQLYSRFELEPVRRLRYGSIMFALYLLITIIGSFLAKDNSINYLLTLLWGSNLIITIIAKRHYDKMEELEQKRRELESEMKQLKEISNLLIEIEILPQDRCTFEEDDFKDVTT